MPEIKFSIDEKNILIGKIQRYFEDQLDHEIGQFDADFLLDFFAKEVGAFYYNRGLHDAQTVLESKLDTISDAIYEIEQPTSF